MKEKTKLRTGGEKKKRDFNHLFIIGKGKRRKEECDDYP